MVTTTATIGGSYYNPTLVIKSNDDESIVFEYQSELYLDGETINLAKTIYDMIGAIRDNDVAYLVIGDDMTRWATEFVIMMVMIAVKDDDIEIEGLENIPDYDTTKNIVKEAPDDATIHELYLQFRKTLTDAIANSVTEVSER